jgi:hypothetical protein
MGIGTRESTAIAIVDVHQHLSVEILGVLAGFRAAFEDDNLPVLASFYGNSKFIVDIPFNPAVWEVRKGCTPRLYQFAVGPFVMLSLSAENGLNKPALAIKLVTGSVCL